MSSEDVQRLVHELQIHQVELEMQNEALREARLELCESRDRYVDLYDFAPVGYVSLTADGGILESNPAAAALLGVSREQLQHQSINRFLAGDSQDDAWRHRTNVLAGDTRLICEVGMQSSTGTPLTVRWESIAGGTEPHRFCRTALIDVSAVRDVQRLEESEARCRQINATLEQRVTNQTREARLLAKAMASLGEGVMITSDTLDWPNPKIVYVNEAVCRITGYAADELIGQTPRILQGDETKPNVLLELRQALSEGQSHRCEVVNYRKDGTAYDAEIFISPLFDGHGQHTNFIGIHRDITERKRTEVSLGQSVAQTTAILASLPAHIAVIDCEGTIVAVNPAWEKFAKDNHGIPDRCNVGANYLQICRDATKPPADEASDVADGLQTILDGRVSDFTIEYSCHSPTQQRWFLLQAAALSDGTGGAVVSHTNITSRVQAEQRLRNNVERQRAILNTASDAIVLIDEKGVIDSVNLSTESMFGYDRDEMIGQNVNLLMPSPYREEHDGYIKRYLETGKAHIIGSGREVVGQRKDGSTFPVDLAVSEVDHMGLFTGAIRDLSERRQVEEELRREQDMTANVLNTVQSIVLLLDPQGNIIQFNPYMAELTGWSLEAVQGRSWFDLFVRASDQANIRILFNRSVDGQSSRGRVTVMLTKDGREREIQWYDTPLTDEDGNLIGLLCSGQDVTENRQLARHVLNAASKEQRRIGQDLHDSVGQEVVGMTMMADAMARSMQKTSTAMAREGIVVPECAGHVQMAAQLANGLKNALRQLKAVARGLHPVEVDPLGLHSALHELAKHACSLYGIECDFRGDEVIAICDKDVATHLYQIAQEATTNAVTHGHAQRVTISLAAANGMHSLQICDNGVGMPADPGHHGGMGLRSMRYRAELIGGRLTIAPGDGAGTLVTCTRPVE